MHDGFELMKTVGPFAQDVQQQIDLAGGFFFQRHGLTKEKRANG
jgi:hypothetical protein